MFLKNQVFFIEYLNNNSLVQRSHKFNVGITTMHCAGDKIEKN